MSIDPGKSIQKMYYQEVERSQSIYNQLSIPSGILIVIGSVLSYFLIKYDYSFGVNTYIFVGISSISAVFFLASICFAFSTLAAFESRELSPPSDWNEYFEDLQRQTSNPNEEFSAGLRRSLAESATSLRRINDRRQNRLYYTYRALMLTVGATFAAGIPYFIKMLG